MGTVPYNFPPEQTMQIGEFLTASFLGKTGPFPPTVFFTAPTTGLYQFAVLLHFIASDGAGTMVINFKPPHTNGFNTAAIVPAVDKDNSINSRGTWMNAGDVFTIGVTTTGFGATTFNLYFSTLRIF